MSEPKSEPHELNNDEVRDLFIERMHEIVAYWEHQAPENTTLHERLNNVMSAVLAHIDGASNVLPPFVLAPLPSKGDKDFHKKRGENWYPETQSTPTDIGGFLHEQYAEGPKKPLNWKKNETVEELMKLAIAEQLPSKE